MVFTPDEVKSLNSYQHARVMHPFTCGGDRCDENHLDGEGLLIATESGWHCPYCSYVQSWAHEFMKNWSWQDMGLGNTLTSISTIRKP